MNSAGGTKNPIEINMGNELRATLRLWRTRTTRPMGVGSQIYTLIMVAMVAVAPVARAAWLSATSDQSIALLEALTQPWSFVMLSLVIWAVALLTGRERGPALRPPLLAHLLAASAMPRARAFGAPVIGGIAAVAGSGLAVAATAGAALAARGVATPGAAVLLSVAGLGVGVIAGVAWLAGQAAPKVAGRAATVLGVVAVSAGAITIAVGSPTMFTVARGATTTLAAALGVCAVLAVLGAPTLLTRLETAQLVGQAAQWDLSKVHLATFDLASAAALYRGGPRIGRRISAIRPGPLWRVFFVRDAIGATRRPYRLAWAIAGLAAAAALCTGVVMAGAHSPFVFPGWLLGAVAGIVMYMALGPLIEGLTHASLVAAGPSLYDMGDAQMLVSHVLFPLVCAMFVALIAAGCVALAGASWGSLSLGAPVLLACIVLAARVAASLKGFIPVWALTPIDSPVGDPGILVLLVWMFDGPLIAVASGALIVSAGAFGGPVLWPVAGGCLLGIVALIVARWRKRG